MNQETRSGNGFDNFVISSLCNATISFGTCYGAYFLTKVVKSYEVLQNFELAGYWPFVRLPLSYNF